MSKIIFFSGGKGSFLVAHYLKNKFPNDNIVLYFTDTLFEDKDLYRFIREVSDKLELPLLIHNIGKTPLDLMEEDTFLYNSRIANCSLKLKVKVAKKFLQNKEKPLYEEWYNKQFLLDEKTMLEKPTLYFGIDFTESHRTKAIIKNWSKFTCEFPLIDNLLDFEEILNLYNIEIPALYKKGFSHNNCAGRCIKGGQAHWLNLLKQDYEKFCQMRDFEEKMGVRINKKKNTNEKWSYLKRYNKPYTLKDLEDDFNKRPETIDLLDFGGCGCFVEDNEDWSYNGTN